MRSLMSLRLKKASGPSAAASGARPEILRRKTIATNARLMVLAAGLGLPFAISLLIRGEVLPFVIAIVAMAGGMGSLALHHRRDYELSARGQALAFALLGTLLAIADPAIADFGMATALLAPVHAALMTTGRFRGLCWLLFAAAMALSLVIGAPQAFSAGAALTAAIAFLVVAGIVARSANRLDQAFEIFDKGQVNAYRHLVEHLQDAVLRFSETGEMLYASKSSEALFGCRRYELSATGLVERVHVLDKPAFMTAFAAANRDGQAQTLQVRMRRDDPAEQTVAPQFVWVEVRLSPVVEGEGRGRYEVVAMLRDVTIGKDHELAMQAARKAAEEASSAKSRFLAVIGHELRTPLNAIVGFSEMMTANIGGELSPAHREYAGLIHQSGHHLLDVVGMLLDMSRIEAGKFELQTDQFDPRSLVAPCLQMVETMARTRNITLATEIGRDLPGLVADERACRQILINLLSNAIKFSHEGGTITLTMRRQGQSLTIAVADNGIGMGQESVARIGEPFFQAQDGLARRYEGTGLGLSIVKGLVDLHQGWLRVVSELGQGTTMTVFLPLNGPAMQVSDTPNVTPLHREPVSHQTIETWQEQRRKAR